MEGLSVRPLRIVSTIPLWGFEMYGDLWLEAAERWPEDVEIVVYAEGFDIRHPRITSRRVEDLPMLVDFKRQYAHYKPVLWQWDIVRWSNKVFSAFDALYDHEGLGLWLDADAIAYKSIPRDLVPSLLPQGAYMALFRRNGMEPETGFWIADCDHPKHQDVFKVWRNWLLHGTFKRLQQWCDASTFNATLKQFEKAGLIEVKNLSGAFANDMHPMAKHPIGRYIDHLKGARKLRGASPENANRQAA